jgi:long-chain acyl-CoA synthetase
MASADGSEIVRCTGLDQAENAQCLSDLLLSSPAQWLDKPMLRFRQADGSWKSWSRIRVQQAVLRVAAWLESKDIKPGDRVGMLGHNCPEWFIADFAILRLGAVTVPAYFTDPSEAICYVFENAEVSLIFVEEGEQQDKLEGIEKPFIPFYGRQESVFAIAGDEQWDNRLSAPCPNRGQLATLIYTSGTTGHPKGVMLTHDNLLTDLAAGLGAVAVFENDLFLSFLPTSHAFERTVGHFLPTACGSEIAYAEDVTTLLRDMPEVGPTIMVSVPRLYEKIYAGVNAKMAASRVKKMLFDKAQSLGIRRFELRQQGKELGGLDAMLWQLLDKIVNSKLREKMGGNIRFFISGGAALHPDIARFLLAADITVLPGYGLTETSPMLSVNREAHIKPATVGTALPGVEMKQLDDGELLVRGPMLMQGYWENPEATKAVFDEDGWLYTGDIVEIDDEGFITIVDRKKEIMVLSNGENIPPAIIEQHLTQMPCVLQAMVIADNRDDVTALIVPDIAALQEVWQRIKRKPLPQNWCENAEVHAWTLQRMHMEEHDLSSYMQVKRFAFVDAEWTQADGFLTPTLKLKRRKIAEHYAELIESLYKHKF